MSLESLIEEWDGQAVIVHFDAPTRSWIFIAIHDDTLGTPVGGTRLKCYPSPAEALRDAMRLAEGMTYKWAAVELGRGGGKAVIVPPAPLSEGDRKGLLRRYGRLLRSLRGSFATGQDLGVTPQDMFTVAEECDVVHGVDPRRDWVCDAGPYTARGVFVGIQASVKHALKRETLEGCRVWIQGAGDVGIPLAEALARAGAVLRITDVDAGRAEELARKVGGAVLDPESAYDEACDVYAPCAIGATLNPQTIERLTCRIVAGSANNQLASPEDAERLAARGILYAPDYIINAGGAIAFGLIHGEGADEATIQTRIDRIGVTLGEIFAAAEERQESPLHAAQRRVEAILARARGSETRGSTRR